MDIRAIETVYKGYRFRSRTEARWAVAFDSLGWRWKYEVEGYRVCQDKAWYLPDFYLPDLKCHIEIKGTDATEEEMSKMFGFGGAKPLLLITGSPWPDEYRADWIDEYVAGPDDHSSFGVCLVCNREMIIRSDGLTVQAEHIIQSDRGCSTERVFGYVPDRSSAGPFLQAFTAARQARFEHGERPRR